MTRGGFFSWFHIFIQLCLRIILFLTKLEMEEQVKKQQQAMADQQKVHPVVNVEAPPSTTPLMPQGSSASDKSSPIWHPPPPSRTIPVIHSRGPKKRNCFCKCFCCTIIIFILVLVIVAATVGILYLVFQPKVPQYSIDSLRISDLRLSYALTLYAKFDVKITANNPNKKIGIYYEKGGQLSVWYTRTMLCQGSIPKFYQGHQNITKLDVSLTGQTESGSTLMTALKEQQLTGRIPLDLKVDAPLAVKLGSFKLRKVRILGDCMLVVDSLSTNNIISIKASNCKFRLKL